MPNWELDPALFLTSRRLAPAPAEEIACVICANPSGDGRPHKICIVDVNPTSRSYSDVVGEIVVEQRDERLSLRSREGNVLPSASRVVCASSLDAGVKIASNVLLAHDREHPYGFSSSGFSVHDLTSAISVWYRDGGPSESRPWAVRKVIEIPAEPEVSERLPELLRPSGAVPPLITDFALSLDDCFLYVACWGTGALKQFDVSDPFFPREVASVCIGGIAAGAAHPSQVRVPGGGPCAVTLSRDGRRVYVTNSLSPAWDAQLYPDGFQGWMVKLDVDPCGGLAFDPNFFVNFGDLRPRQVRLQGQGLG